MDLREVSIAVGRKNWAAHDKAQREWGIAVGDVVHQLRAALDTLVFTLTERTSVIPPARRDPWRDVAFPIITDPTGWAEAKSRCLWGIPEELLPLFRDVQPFVTGQQAPKREPLAVMHKLWNVDKHRTVPVVAVDFVLPEVGDLPPELGIKEIRKRTGPLEDGKEVLRLSYPEGITQEEVASQLNRHLKYSFQVALDQMPPWIPNRPLIMDAVQLFQKTATIILAKFDPHFS